MRCRSQNCTREAETAWITDRITPEGRNEQLPVCGQHLVRLANREPVEWRPEDEERPAESEWVVRVVLRDAPEHKLAPARRRALLHRYAVVAAGRLAALSDPAGHAELRAALRVE